MVRSAWAMPMTLVQKFEANEAVASCLQVKCASQRYGERFETRGATGHPAEKDGDNPWHRDEKLTVSAILNVRKHEGNVCREPNYNLVYGSDGTFTGINGWEVVYQSDDNHDGITEVGDRVYWCNDETYNVGLWKEYFNYNHWGTVELGNRS